jgi:CO/xanthine dehydrogenase Mo-binding subunit
MTLAVVYAWYSSWLGSLDCGGIVNPKTAISQLRGRIVMGMGMALRALNERGREDEITILTSSRSRY